MASDRQNVLPGLRLGLSITGSYLTIMVLVPLAAVLIAALSLSPSEFWAAAFTRRALAAYSLTIGSSFIAAALNVALGLLLAWVLVRYDFPFKKLADSLIDLPFALPTAVAGLVYANLYSDNGWMGQWLAPLGIHPVYNRQAIVLVLVFLGLPFVVRTVQPVLESFDAEVEEAAASLGATRAQTFRAVLFPQLIPALVTGFALALARALGEYGAVIFVSGNMPFKTEVAPKLIVEQLEQYQYASATAIATVLLFASLLMLGLINWLEHRRARFDD